MTSADPADLAVNEPILWRWMATDRSGAPKPVRKHLVTGWNIVLAVASTGFVVWLYYGTSYCDTHRCYDSVIFLVLLALLVILLVLRIFRQDTRDLEVAMFSGAKDPFALHRGYVLTPTRLLKLGWDGSFESYPFREGAIRIKYGNVRLSRAEGPDEVLIWRMPVPQQNQFFAAIKQARAMQGGRTETPA